MAIFIIGNGFDLSHNLHTTYRHFFNHIIEESITDRRKHSDLVRFPYSIETTDEFLASVKSNSTGIRFENTFFGCIAKDIVGRNWCDIEALYFEKLKSIDNEDDKWYGQFDNITELNNDFRALKDKLESYLIQVTKPSVHTPVYNELFTGFQKRNNDLILNFNYTETFGAYDNNAEVINIHGELRSKLNPIIFGYSAFEDDISELRKQDIEYDSFIKENMYLISDNETRLRNYLSQLNQRDFVIILGHSCGKSDSQILGTIFNHKFVEKIIIFYYNQETFLKQTSNIRNIFSSAADRIKILNYKRSLHLPQPGVSPDYNVALQEFQSSLEGGTLY